MPPSDARPTREAVHSRALGAVLASAAGDALGAPYELKPNLADLLPPPPADVPLKESRRFARGEWTDDTAMAIPLLEAAAAHADLREPRALDRVVYRWMLWASPLPGGGHAKGIGRQTRTIFRTPGMQAHFRAGEAGLGAACEAEARKFHEQTGRSAGNGSLMRVGPLALGYLDDEAACAAAARAQARLTHPEEDACDGAVLWALAVRHAILTGEADVRVGLELLPREARERWAPRLDEADIHGPEAFAEKSTWVVAALQAAWASVRLGAGGGVKGVLETAVRGGGDTDTVAAIAGALAGAVHGAESVPRDWVEALHGWPGINARDLNDMVEKALARY